MTRIIKLDGSNKTEVIASVLKYLRQGKTVVYPTETFYGLGCDLENGRAVGKIYLIKGRERTKHLPFIAASRAMAEKYVKFNVGAKRLAKKHWPGPLSLVLPATKPGRRILGQASGGVRISSNDFASALVKRLGRPLVSTSANLADLPAAQSARDVLKYFHGRKHAPDLIVDVGRLKKSKGSTFIDLTGKEPKVLRQGDTKIKNLKLKI